MPPINIFSIFGRVRELGLKESLKRLYYTGDIHHLYGDLVGIDKAGNKYKK